MRQKSVDIGCITKEEYQTLKKYGSYPTCNLLKGEGLEMLDGWCPCGCFHPEMKIKTFNPQNSIEENIDVKTLYKLQNNLELIHLSPDAIVSSLYFDRSKVYFATKGLEPLPIIIIKTEDNRTLKLTQMHPVLVNTGVMKLAKDISNQDFLVDFSGQSIKVTSVSQQHYSGEVYNFSTGHQNTPTSHIIFANDFAVGDQYWQASLEHLINRIVIRQ